jgi:hypothetical protein
LADLDFARGVFPTKLGDIEVELERNDGGFEARVRAPEKMRVHLKAAQGLKLRSATERSLGALQAQYEFEARG